MSIMKITKGGQPIDELYFNISEDKTQEFDPRHGWHEKKHKSPPPPPPRLSPSALPYYVAALSFMAMAGVCIYLLGSEFGLRVFAKPEKTLAYLEIRVIGSDLGPVVGAGIYHGKKLLGKTDSFGEWKRQFKVRLGSLIQLKAEKDYPGAPPASVSRQIVVPLDPPRSGPLRLGAQIKLQGPQSASAPAPVRVLHTESTATLSEAPAAPPSTTWSVTDNPHSTTEVDLRKQSQLRDKVLGPLKVSIPEALTAQLRHLPFLAPDAGVGVIEVTVQRPGASETRFLKPYTGDLETTITGLKDGILQPHPGWQRVSRKLPDVPLIAGAQVYVFGYEAQVGDHHTVSFWLRPTSRSGYVTIVKDHRIIFRKIISLEGAP